MVSSWQGLQRTREKKLLHSSQSFNAGYIPAAIGSPREVSQKTFLPCHILEKRNNPGGFFSGQREE
jgi:hypothetical protein